MGSGLAFCLSEQAHTKALKFPCKDESVIDTSCLQDEIATPLFICKKRGITRNVMG